MMLVSKPSEPTIFLAQTTSRTLAINLMRTLQDGNHLENLGLLVISTELPGFGVPAIQTVERLSRQ